MADYDKADLDAMTEMAADVLRESLPLPPLNAEYAKRIAGYLAVQFPDSTELGRIVLACAQYLAALGAAEAHGAIVVSILGASGLQLDATRAEGTCPGGC